jgi:adenylate cyclase
MKEKSESAILCKGCWDQMKAPVPIRGPFSIPFKIFGITQSKMNPNICTICERAFRRVKKRDHFSQDATILFSDIRGYTQLSETIDPLELSDIVSAFQDQCAHSIWAQDGIVNKQMGDGLMAIFNFPIKAEDHTGRAIDAAFDIQRRCSRNLSQLAGRLALPAGELGIGVGIHSGAVEIGEFGKERSDFTAIGGGVNLAARLESSARAGEIILSPDAATRVPGKLGRAEQRLLDLKGVSEPVPVYILKDE